ncbi:TfoX/Sxy family protein [Ancylobacter lacus]|uniref:TfoX/Sxy family protein n=1 Tax=Ancylobacter lacus TaxID=2579970 RepID=UPI001BCC039C|nr:TfoX/Sxy family protein [Ancylobacter lacus]MBS7540259.1 TfoX/Sxy family protein [Ancylobacter lacus]
MERADIEEIFSAFGPVALRRMFGGLGIYADGVMFALVVDGELYLKADAALAQALEAAGSTPFAYDRQGRRVVLGYWSMPSAALEDADTAAELARRALAVAQARRLPAGGRRAGPRG